MKELKYHIAILIGLIIVSLSIWISHSTSSSTDSNFDYFQISDTSKVISIQIERTNAVIQVIRNEGQWTLNDTLQTDPSLIKIFNAIMTQVQVLRPVSHINFQEIKNDIIEEGQKVVVTSEDDSYTFFTGGNAKKTQSYFANEDLSEIYLVSIPGYNNYLSGIFELTLDQWRDRVLFSSSYRTIQNLTIEFTNSQNEDLEMYFEDRFMKVKGVQSIDTTSLMQYLAQFEHFQVNDYLRKGAYPKFDSLLSTAPIAILSLKDIDKTKNKQIKIFNKIPSQRFYLFLDADQQMIVIDENRVNQLLKSPDFFASK